MNTSFSRLHKKFNKSILIVLFFSLGFQNCSVDRMDSYDMKKGPIVEECNRTSQGIQEKPIRGSYKIEELSFEDSSDPKFGVKCPTCQIVLKKSGGCSSFWKYACIAGVFLVIGIIVGFLPTYLIGEGQVVFAKAETGICNAKLAINQDCANLKVSLCNIVLGSPCASSLYPSLSNYC